MQRIGLTQGLPGDAPLEFMQTRMIMPEDIVYSEEMDDFLPEPEAKELRKQVRIAWEATHKDKQSLFRAIEAFREKLAKKDPNVVRIDLGTCTWPEVMTEFERALQYYKAKRQAGATGKIYTSLQKLGENADLFQSWLGLLPSGDYGAPICGAFAMIIQTVGRMHNVHSIIYEALRDIPDAVSKARRYLEVYRDVKALELCQKTAELFSAVLNTLETIIAFLTESGIKRVRKAILKGDEYSRPIVKKIEGIKRLGAQIDQEAKICAEHRARRTDENVGHLVQKVSDAQNTLCRIHQLFLANPNLDPHTRKPFPAQIIDKSPKKRHKKRRANQPSEESTKDRQKHCGSLTASHVLSILSYDPGMIAVDIDRCRLDGEELSLSDKDRTSSVAHSTQLQTWLLRSQVSCALLILANVEQSTTHFSPLSFLVAELAHLYADTDSTATVSFFCGLHVQSWRDRRANATGLAASILGQLLSYDRFERQFDFGFIDDRLSEQLANDNIEAMCEIFKRLVLQIKEPVVLFAFIDTISIYETRERLRETTIVVEMLQGLVKETARRQTWPERGQKGSSVVFKLLITDPGQSCYVEGKFEHDEIFLVDECTDGNMQNVFDLQGLEGV